MNLFKGYEGVIADTVRLSVGVSNWFWYEYDNNGDIDIIWRSGAWLMISIDCPCPWSVCFPWTDSSPGRAIREGSWQLGKLLRCFWYNRSYMWFLCDSMFTEVRRSILLEAGIDISGVTATCHTSTVVILSLLTPTNVVLGILVLILIAAASEPRASHAELIRRSCLFRWFACWSCILLGICSTSIELKTSSCWFRVHWHILIFSLVARKPITIAGKFLRRSSFAF